jgi:hypothetical protein
MIAGAALVVQGLAKANKLGDNANDTFSPAALRAILSDPAFGTASANPPADLIGSMPDLVKIIDQCLKLGPDVYLRDFLKDAGAPHAELIGNSPDIIVRNTQVSNYNTEFGQESTKRDQDQLGESVEDNDSDKYVYLRVINRGATLAENVEVTLYWSEDSNLVAPGSWHTIGSSVLTSVPAGEMRVCQIVWPGAAVPSSGNYSLICLVGNPRDPAPSRPNFAVLNDYDNFIRQFNNVTSCRFKVW